MTYYDAYIGILEDPDFDWETYSNIGNVPTRQSPFFPRIGASHSPYSLTIKMIESGLLVGKQTDWGGWVAKVSKSQLIELVDDWYKDEPSNGQGIREYIDCLDDEKIYALVATEL